MSRRGFEKIKAIRPGAKKFVIALSFLKNIYYNLTVNAIYLNLSQIWINCDKLRYLHSK